MLAIAIRPALDNDLWWHLRSGRWMVDHRRILGADPFSHTADGDRRLPFDWLAQLGLYGVWGVGGLLAGGGGHRRRRHRVRGAHGAGGAGAGDGAGGGGRPDRRGRLGVLVGPSPDRHQPPRRGGGLGALAAPPDRRSRCGGWSRCSCSGRSSTSAGCTGSRLIWVTVGGSLVDRRLGRGMTEVRTAHLAAVGRPVVAGRDDQPGRAAGVRAVLHPGRRRSLLHRGVPGAFDHRRQGDPVLRAPRGRRRDRRAPTTVVDGDRWAARGGNRRLRADRNPCRAGVRGGRRADPRGARLGPVGVAFEGGPQASADRRGDPRHHGRRSRS